jgi:hypothetical protein
LTISYFDAGIKTRLLELVEQPGEKAIEIVELLKRILAKNNLDFQKMVSVCMDNTAANFGGEQRGGQKNIFYKLKEGI